MADTTLRLLAPGVAIGLTDLLLTRQGVDTVDKSITGTQLRNFIVASGPFITSLGTVTSGTLDGGTP